MRFALLFGLLSVFARKGCKLNWIITTISSVSCEERWTMPNFCPCETFVIKISLWVQLQRSYQPIGLQTQRPSTNMTTVRWWWWRRNRASWKINKKLPYCLTLSVLRVCEPICRASCSPDDWWHKKCYMQWPSYNLTWRNKCCREFLLGFSMVWRGIN